MKKKKKTILLSVLLVVSVLVVSFLLEGCDGLQGNGHCGVTNCATPTPEPTSPPSKNNGGLPCWVPLFGDCGGLNQQPQQQNEPQPGSAVPSLKATCVAGGGKWEPFVDPSDPSTPRGSCIPG